MEYLSRTYIGPQEEFSVAIGYVSVFIHSSSTWLISEIALYLCAIMCRNLHRHTDALPL